MVSVDVDADMKNTRSSKIKSKNGKTNNIEVNVDVEDILKQRTINTHEQHHQGKKKDGIISSMDVCFW